MASRRIPSLVSYIRGLVQPSRSEESGLSDAELLERFVTSRDEAAFELLVWRHGSLVFGVCKRVLEREQDAEDAFQATFLALLRKASSITRKESVVGWLYRVAYRAALAAGKRADRCESPLAGPDLDALLAAPDVLDDWDLRPILDDEVNRLPERYRVPFILCCLDGMTVDEAAAELGRPRGTIGASVSRAKEALRARLARRGVALSAAALTAASQAMAASVSPPVVLVRETVRAGILIAAGEVVPDGLLSGNVLFLLEKVLTTMFVTKLKMAAAAVALVIGLGTMTGIVAHGALAANPPATLADERPAGSEKGPKIDKAPMELHGFSGEVVGKLISRDAEKGSLVLEIRQVKNVWKGNKAKKPKSAEGKTLKIDGVFGKFLDVLVTLKAGDGVQIEVKHVKGDNLTFLGEELKKVDLPPVKAKDRD